MTKKEIQKSIEESIGGSLVSIVDVSRWSGRSIDYVKKHIVKGLEYTSHGKSKLFFSGDVAERIVSETVEQ